jgi:hypothetical protein
VGEATTDVLDGGSAGRAGRSWSLFSSYRRSPSSGRLSFVTGVTRFLIAPSLSPGLAVSCSEALWVVAGGWDVGDRVVVVFPKSVSVMRLNLRTAAALTLFTLPLFL